MPGTVPCCQIQWVEKENGWNPTPDSNDAIGFAICYFASIHRDDGSIFPGYWSEPRAICAQHAERMKSLPNWVFLPLPGAPPSPTETMIRTFPRVSAMYFDLAAPWIANGDREHARLLIKSLVMLDPGNAADMEAALSARAEVR